nr:helix-turn-helix domain-containing protein [[Pseudomonas] sp. BICA1-14]
MRENLKGKPEAELQLRQGDYQNVMSMTARIVAPATDLVDHSAEAQAARLVAALRTGPVSTITAAKDLDIVHPPSTVRRLRRDGWGIVTEWTYIPTEPGRKPHRVGLYVLVAEAA